MRNLESVGKIRVASMRWGSLIAIVAIATGGVLLALDKSIAGYTVFLSAVAGLIGTAVYGHKNQAEDKKKPDSNPEESRS